MPTPDRCIRGPLRIAVLARSLVSVLLHNLPSLLGAEVAQLSKLVLSVLSAVFRVNQVARNQGQSTAAQTVGRGVSVKTSELPKAPPTYGAP